MIVDIKYQKASCVFMSVVIKHDEYIRIPYECPHTALQPWSLQKVLLL